MTSVWPPSPKPREDSEPDAVSTTVVGPGGTRFLDCGIVAGVDKCIRFLQGQLIAHAQWPKRCDQHWQDIDQLLDQRRILQLEAWLSPSDLPL